MKKVSVIVPIYKGQQYIAGIIKQLEDSATIVGNGTSIELVLVNDDPDRPFGSDLKSDIIDIQGINTDVNRGIHGARVRGLMYCKGEYIVFLDQDDQIYKDFLAKQLALIGTADAIVCNVLHDGHAFYDVDSPLNAAISRESMLFNQNMIISPGQVLIRAKAIPSIWKENIMSVTGADDWLLWICMLCTGKKFVANEEVLFEHRIHYSNTSIDSVRMADSENEVVRIVEQNKLLVGEELERIKVTVFRAQRKRLRDNEKCKRMFRVLSDWMTAREHGISISDYLKQFGIYNVAIYGFGHFGKHLFSELKKSDIKIRCIIDRNAKYIDTDIAIKTLDDEIEEVDAVVVAILKDSNVDMIEHNIKQKLDARLFWITDIVSEMLKKCH